jgi:hypothetical protein
MVLILIEFDQPQLFTWELIRVDFSGRDACDCYLTGKGQTSYLKDFHTPHKTKR